MSPSARSRNQGRVLAASSLVAALVLVATGARGQEPSPVAASTQGDTTQVAAPDFKSEKHGYWWYESKPAEEQPDTDKHPDLQAPPPTADLEKLYPADLQKMLDNYRNYALWKTTPEHVAWYYQLQDVARRKSVQFMNTTQYVMLTKPDLNVATDYPATSPGLVAHTKAVNQEVESLVDSQADKAAIVLLTRKSCPYCPAQRNTIRYFLQKHPNWEVREFDLDEHPEMKERFGTDSTPTTVVIFRGVDQRWFPVSVGVDSVQGTEEGLFRAIRMLNGTINPQNFTMQDYQQGGVMDPQGAPR